MYTVALLGNSENMYTRPAVLIIRYANMFFVRRYMLDLKQQGKTRITSCYLLLCHLFFQHIAWDNRGIAHWIPATYRVHMQHTVLYPGTITCWCHRHLLYLTSIGRTNHYMSHYYVYSIYIHIAVDFYKHNWNCFLIIWVNYFSLFMCSYSNDVE